jgi:type II secretory pathway pseudopilin PulG
MLSRSQKKRVRGVTAVEVSLLVSIVGIFLAIFVPRFLDELQVRKTTEAVTVLAQMHQRTAAYFDVQRTIDGRSLRWCIPPAAGPSPPTPSTEPVEASFTQPGMPGRVTWEALEFQPPPIYFRYSFIPEADGCGIRREVGVPLVNYLAEGDLDGDGILSTFEASASVTMTGELVRLGGVRAIRGTE